MRVNPIVLDRPLSRVWEGWIRSIQTGLMEFASDSGFSVHGSCPSRTCCFASVQRKNQETAALSRVDGGRNPTSIEQASPAETGCSRGSCETISLGPLVRGRRSNKMAPNRGHTK